MKKIKYILAAIVVFPLLAVYCISGWLIDKILDVRCENPTFSKNYLQTTIMCGLVV